MKLSAVISYKDCIKMGYPFAEAILSMMPIVDEFLINDGGSTDGTLEVTKRIVEMFPEKARLYRMFDYKCDRWHCVSEQYNRLIAEAKGDWIFQGNADELMHDNEVYQYKSALATMKSVAVRHLRHEIFNWWSEMGWYDYWPARAVMNIPGVFQDWPSQGGDEFLIMPDWHWLRYPPECENISGFMMWHYYTMFPDNMVEKMRHDAEDVAPTDVGRVQQFKHYKDHGVPKPPEWYGKKTVVNQPRIITDLTGSMKYTVRECLFDKEWLRKIYPTI